jgi:hypothetical protein
MRTQRLTRILVLFAIGFVGGAGNLGAQTQTVTFAVNAINQISFAGSPSLIITTAVAGSDPTSAVDATSTWAVTCNQTGAKVSASIPSVMGTGLTLKVNLTAPVGATSAGLLALGTVSVDLVTVITKEKGSGLNATYQLDATALAGVVTSATKVVTYTISGGA